MKLKVKDEPVQLFDIVKTEEKLFGRWVELLSYRSVKVCPGMDRTSVDRDCYMLEHRANFLKYRPKGKTRTTAVTNMTKVRGEVP